MRRREFITLVGGAAATWPLAARAQQAGMPVVGFLRHTSAGDSRSLVSAFIDGLNKSGFNEGQNIAIEYRWADNRSDRLPAMAADLVRREVAVIVAGGNDPTVAVKLLTTTIPIVAVTGNDPMALGFVASMNRPEANITGVSFLSVAIAAKRLELLHLLTPEPAAMAFMMDPRSAETAAEQKDVEAAARALRRQLFVLNASSEREIETVFETLVEKKIGGLLVGSGAIFNSHRKTLIGLAAHHKIPASYLSREFAVDGGLMTYGANTTDAYRQAGVYVSQILRGAKPSELPFMLPVKFDLIVNVKTAKALGLTIPDKVFALADEVIE